MTIGDRIRERRAELDVSVDELADVLGKSRATVYRYEKGDIKNLPTTVLEPLADALYTTPAYLMGWTDDPHDWERIGNENGICPPNDFDGDFEDYVRYKTSNGSEKDAIQTLATHFDGDEYTEDEMNKIKEFAAFVKSQRK